MVASIHELYSPSQASTGSFFALPLHLRPSLLTLATFFPESLLLPDFFPNQITALNLVCMKYNVLHEQTHGESELRITRTFIIKHLIPQVNAENRIISQS